ncbi:MAG TPA: S8/S53 family peptidase [Solirubrobacterales bacterium]|nr:S8/S53 family peptidase [Solirubrobacterales bacterium]
MHKTQLSPSNGHGDRPGRQVHALLLFLAIFSVAMIGTAAVAIAAPAAEIPANTPQPPMELPPIAAGGGAAISGATSSSSKAGTWVVAGRPGALSERIAARNGAKPVAPKTGIYRVGRNKARALAARFEGSGLLIYAEPDVDAVKSGYPADLYQNEQWWLDNIVNTESTTPPPVSEFSPELALIEESVDPFHPDLITARLAGALSLGPKADWHGTAVAAIAGSPGEMNGIRGVWPGMKMRLVPMGTKCSTATKAVVAAVRAKSAVLNMSYGFPSSSCYSHYVATEFAVQNGVLPVAAAGNTGGEGGNVPMRPATDPHVISVSSVNSGWGISPFSTTNSGVDITAPGENVFAPSVSASADGTKVDRGWQNLNGTSFSTPMVAAAATWLRQARPDLDARQVGRALTSSATDIDTPGRDSQYGEGALNIEAALTVTAPPPDPMEPNDDIQWLDGSLLNKKAKFLYKPKKKGKRKASVTATLSRVKDPADVYKVRIAAKGKVLITGAQYQSDIRIEVLKSKATTVTSPGKNLIVRSDRPRTKIEGVRIKNLKPKAQTIYVSVTQSARVFSDYSHYKLSVVG